MPVMLALALACSGGDKPDSTGDDTGGIEDADGDGFPASDDCDDGDPEVHPDATELCNGIDDDCDGEEDESDAADAQAWYLDADTDGFGDPLHPSLACNAPDGHVASADADSFDCDDSDETVHPGAPELCNSVDDDCDGVVDDGFLEDTDEDGTIDCLDDCPVYARWGAEGAQDGSSGAPYASIQQALDDRGDWCDEVLVLPGTYEEHIDLGTRDVVLRSTDGAESTVIMGTDEDSVVTIMGGQSTDTVVAGFTVSGGGGRPGDESLGFDSSHSAYGLGHGGGFVVMESDPIIEDCVITGNTVDGQGGGLFLKTWDGVLQNSVIEANESRFWSGSGGGANVYGGAGTIRGNDFIGNLATGSSGDGGALHLWAEAKTVVEANHFQDNWADESGGAVRSYRAAAFIRNNLMIDNHPQAIQISAGDAGNVSFNTISGTTSSAISVRIADGVDIITSFDNNIVSGAGGYCLAVPADTSADFVPSSFTGNVFHDCTEGTTSGSASLLEGDGNMETDPQLLADGSSRQWCLQEGSPLIDAATASTAIDFYGTTRPLGDAADIGACESY